MLEFGDFRNPGNTKVKDIDAVSLLIPASLPNPFDGLHYAKNVIDAAKATGVNKIVWNTCGWLLPHKMGIPGEDVKLACPTPEAMLIGWIASRDVSAFVVEAGAAGVASYYESLQNATMII